MPESQFKRILVKSDKHLQSVCDRLQAEESYLSVDSETTGLNPRRDKLRLVQISGRDVQEIYIIDYFHITNPKPLRDLMLNEIPKLCYNGQFDCIFFMHNFNAYIECPIDLYLGAILLQRYGLPEGINPESDDAWKQKLVPYLKGKLVKRGKYSNGTLKLNSVLKLFTGLDMSKEQQRSDWSGELTDEQLDYAAKDVELLFPLADKILEEIIKEGLEDAYASENGCQLATAMLHYYGIKLDTKELNLLGKEIKSKLQIVSERISKYPEFQSSQQTIEDMINGTATTIDLASPQQCVAALNKRWGYGWWKEIGMEKPSVQAGDLKRFYDRDPELVTLMSQRASLQSMYSNHIEGLSAYIDPDTGRIHSNYRQNTGPQQRFASERPILLNLPTKVSYGSGVKDKNSIMYSERNFRDIFVPEEGCVFVKADYSALQLKALAQESNDPTLIDIFRNKLDAHKITASAITGKPEPEIEDKSPERDNAKTVNYAVGFVCGPRLLQSTFAEDDIHIPLADCKLFIQRYMGKYKRVPIYHKEQPQRVRQAQRVEVFGGRATLFNGDVGTRLTDSINFPMALYEVSGARKSLMRIARLMWKLQERGINAKLVLAVHDEIVLEVQEEYGQACAEILEREMVQCMERYIYKVPIEADSKVCRSWGGKAVEIKKSLPLPFEVRPINGNSSERNSI